MPKQDRTELHAPNRQYFICATNRPQKGPDGRLLEEHMHDNQCAAMWEWRESDGRKVKSLKHMERVRRGDLIFMFSNGKESSRTKGIIGVGQATGGRRGPFDPGSDQRLRGDDWEASEWQIPLQWLLWRVDDPFLFMGQNATFYDVTGKRLQSRCDEILESLPTSQ